MTERYANKSPVDIQTIFTNQAGVPITNALGKITVQRMSDKKYWDGDSWEVASTLLSMTKISDSNSPGLWEFILITINFDPDSYLFVSSDDNANAFNSPQTAKAIVGDELARLATVSAAGVVGKATYDDSTSVETVSEYDDPNTILKSFNILDSEGNAAQTRAWNQKVPI